MSSELDEARRDVLRLYEMLPECWRCERPATWYHKYHDDIACDNCDTGFKGTPDWKEKSGAATIRAIEKRIESWQMSRFSSPEMSEYRLTAVELDYKEACRELEESYRQYGWDIGGEAWQEDLAFTQKLFSRKLLEETVSDGGPFQPGQTYIMPDGKRCTLGQPLLDQGGCWTSSNGESLINIAKAVSCGATLETAVSGAPDYRDCQACFYTAVHGNPVSSAQHSCGSVLPLKKHSGGGFEFL